MQPVAPVQEKRKDPLAGFFSGRFRQKLTERLETIPLWYKYTSARFLSRYSEKAVKMHKKEGQKGPFEKVFGPFFALFGGFFVHYSHTKKDAFRMQLFNARRCGPYY